jgi:hypothetical protein
VLAALTGIAMPTHAFDLAELMKTLARHGPAQASFEEQRFVKGLDQPLVSTGTLAYEPPDRFTRRTLSPRAETMVVAGDRLVLSREGRTRTLALDAAPEAVMAVEALRGTLKGDAAALQRVFRVSLSGDASRWTLDLLPVDAQSAGNLAEVRIGGQRDGLREVRTLYADGSRTVLSIVPMDAAAPASAASS